MRGIPASVTGGTTGSKLIYSELTDSCSRNIRSAETRSAQDIQRLLREYCEILISRTDNEFVALTDKINKAIPLIEQLKYEKRGSRVYILHSRDLDDQLMEALPDELRLSVISTLQNLAIPKRPDLVRPTFDSRGSLGNDLRELNRLKDSGELSAEQVSDLIEGFIAKIDSLDALAQYVGGSEESPFRQPIIKAKSFTTDPSKKLSELQEYLNSLDSSTGNRALIVRRVKILAVQEWHKSHSIGVEGGKKINPDFVTQYKKIFEGMQKDSYSPEDIAEIIQKIDLLVNKLREFAFSTEELEEYKRRFGLFLDKDVEIRLEQDGDAPHGFGLGSLYNSIFTYIKRNSGLSPKKPEQATSSIDQRVSSATSINELFTIVRELGTIPSSVGDFSAQEVIDNINGYFSGTRKLTNIPSQYGIRKAAERIKSKTQTGSTTEQGNEKPTFDQEVSRARNIDELKAIIRDPKNAVNIGSTGLTVNDIIGDIDIYIEGDFQQKDLKFITSLFGIRNKVAELAPIRR
jgi:hypothetical protein